jgi:phosphoribosylformimino-5-aminoimidazole carboxamide ribonucleotide (ProFAR) isomerase
VLSHGGAEPDVPLLAELVVTHAAEFLVAGGVTDAAVLVRLRDAGVSGVILGEALLAGAMDYPTAVAAAA